jgi:CBS domain-containing protein
LDVLTTAAEIMSADPITVGPKAKVKDMAQMMVDNRISCLPVVDEDGILLGIVSEDDLVHPETKVRFPTPIHFLESYLMLPSTLHKFEEQLHRALGSIAEEVMNREPVIVDPERDVEEIAGLMVEKEQEYAVVVEGGRLAGIITEADILKTIAGG